MTISLSFRQIVFFFLLFQQINYFGCIKREKTKREKKE
jgi:hypothetical protein